MDELDNSWALTSAGQKRTYYFSGERNDLKGQGHQTSGTGVAPEQPAMRYIDRNKRLSSTYEHLCPCGPFILQ